MSEMIPIHAGGVVLLLNRADGASVAAQLANAGIVAEGSSPPSQLVLGDDDPVWARHSGGSRHDGPDWGQGDESLAESQYRLPPLTAKFHQTLVDHPGQLLSVEDLSRITDGALSNSRVIAGALGGYVPWCERLGRRFPFYWWEGRNGQSTTYAMQHRVAALFRSARVSQYAGVADSTPSEARDRLWIYENWVANGHRATVHRGDCRFCNDGAGIHGGGQTPNGRWLGPFTSRDEARNSVGREDIEMRDCARCKS